MRRLTWSCCALLAVLLLPSLVHAGQLFTESYGLADIVQSPGIAFLGTVVAIDAAKSTLTVLVERVWRTAGRDSTLMVWSIETDAAGHSTQTGNNVPVTVGARVTVPIYRGLVWTDPNKSPIDRRLRSGLPFESIVAQQKLIVLGKETVAATAAELRKLDLYFGGAIPGTYPHTTARAQLETDLADFDLGKLAYHELLQRHELRTETLLALAGGGGRTLLAEHLEGLDAAGKKSFLVDALRVLRKAPAPAERLYLARMLDSSVTEAMLPEAAELALLLDEKNYDEGRARESLLREIERILEAQTETAVPSPSVARALLHAHRPTVSPAPEFVGWARGLHPGYRALLVDEAFVALQHELGAPGNVEAALHLLSALAELVVAAPEARHARALASLPLARIQNFAARSSAAFPAVAMAAALGQHDATTIAVLRPSLEKLLTSEETQLSPPQTQGGLTIQSGFVISVESQMGGEDLETYRRLYRPTRR